MAQKEQRHGKLFNLSNPADLLHTDIRLVIPSEEKWRPKKIELRGTVTSITCSGAIAYLGVALAEYMPDLDPHNTLVRLLNVRVEGDKITATFETTDVTSGCRFTYPARIERI